MTIRTIFAEIMGGGSCFDCSANKSDLHIQKYIISDSELNLREKNETKQIEFSTIDIEKNYKASVKNYQTSL